MLGERNVHLNEKGSNNLYSYFQQELISLRIQKFIIPLHLKELFDSIAPQNTENRTVAKPLPLFLKYSINGYYSNGYVKLLKI